jgi:hypothetical protein
VGAAARKRDYVVDVALRAAQPSAADVTKNEWQLAHRLVEPRKVFDGCLCLTGAASGLLFVPDGPAARGQAVRLPVLPVVFFDFWTRVVLALACNMSLMVVLPVSTATFVLEQPTLLSGVPGWEFADSGHSLLVLTYGAFTGGLIWRNVSDGLDAIDIRPRLAVSESTRLAE